MLHALRSQMRLAAVLLGTVLVVGAAVAGTVGQVVSTTTDDTRPVALARDLAEREEIDVAPTTTVSSTTTTLPLTTTTAPSTTTTTVPGFDAADRSPGWEQRLGEAALARIDFDPARLGYEIRFLPARPGYYGMTYPKERRIDVWVRPDQGLELLTHVTAHEMGHAVDLTWNDDARRREYLELRRLGSRSWFTCDGCTDFSTPAGDFAEVFAFWAVGGTDFRSTLGPPPTPGEYEQLERFFAP